MNRTGFLAAAATLSAAATGVAGAQNVPGGARLVERKADFDAAAFAKTVGRQAEIRQVWEAVAFKPGIWNNVKNAFNGLQFGFGYPAGSMAIAFAGHGPSASYGYSDYVWKKYRIGEFFSITDASGSPATRNAYVAARAPFDASASPDDENGSYQDASIETLQRRGLMLLTCHTAVEEQARGLVKKGLAPSGMTADGVAADILQHLIPGAIVVPSMVATIAVLQATYRYTFAAPQL
jgi:hypothetical protein